MAMHSIEQIKDIIAPLAQSYGVKRIMLFGSYADGTAREDSDIDLLVEFSDRYALSWVGLSRMELEFSDSLGIPVDVVKYPLSESCDLEVQKVVVLYGENSERDFDAEEN